MNIKGLHRIQFVAPKHKEEDVSFTDDFDRTLKHSCECLTSTKDLSRYSHKRLKQSEISDKHNNSRTATVIIIKMIKMTVIKMTKVMMIIMIFGMLVTTGDSKIDDWRR